MGLRQTCLRYSLPQDMEAGALDECLPRILPMVESQVFGGISEEKEAGAFAGTREGKRLRAYDNYQMLAQGMTFHTQLANLLSLVSCLSPHAPSKYLHA